MGKAKKLFITAAMGLCLFSSAAFGQGKISVRVPAETTIAADQITLGDIAEVSGGDAVMQERVKHISLGFSPRIGAMREIQRTNLLLALAAAGFNEGDVLLDAGPASLVKRAAQSLSRDTLRKTIEKAILPQLEAENISARITKCELPGDIDLPTGNIDVRVVNFSGITNFQEPVIVSLELRVDGKVLRRVSANVEVEANAAVLVLTHNAVAGAKLGEGDVRRENVRLERSISSYLRTTADLAGKKLLKNLSESSPLTTDAVAADMVIKTGDTISILARMGNTQISVSGEARASGRIGDRIAVKNTQSGIILQAQVVDQGLVKLNF